MRDGKLARPSGGPLGGPSGPARSRCAIALLCSAALLGCIPGGAEEPPAASSQGPLSGDSAGNLALGRPASQSSTHQGSEAARAVDGSTDGNWYNNGVTHTELEEQPWWQVDLGAVTGIGEVVLYNRTDCCSARLADFDVLLSDDGATWRIAASYGGAAPARTALSIQAPGRFVRIQLRGADYLSLAEVQVFGWKDLALGKPTSQSSTHQGSEAARAVDGNTDGNWHNNSVTHTELEERPWWQVDLGEVTEIGWVDVWNRTDCCATRLTPFELQLSRDGSAWETVKTHGGPVDPWIRLAVGASGRFVRVRLIGTDYLSLAEVQVFAPQNLAMGKAATQSSTHQGSEVARAVDGNTDGNWAHGSVTHTEFEPQPWWQVDLGAVMSIGKEVLYNRTDCCGARLADFDVEISSNKIDWQPAAGFTGVAPVRTELAIGTSGRFVRVRLRGTDHLSLAEVQIFAP